MAPFTKVNGEMSSERVSAGKNGQMAPATRATGLTTRQTGLESCFTRMVTFMKANGRMIRLTAKAPTLMQTGRDTRAIGEMTNSTVSALKHGPMVPFTKASTAKERKMEKESLPSLMAPFTMVTSR